MQPQIETLDLTTNQRTVVLAHDPLVVAMAWVDGSRLAYVLNEKHLPAKTIPNVWWSENRFPDTSKAT